LKIKQIFIDAAVADNPLVRQICDRIGLNGETVPDAGPVYRFVSAAADPVQRGKEVLYLTRNRGRFVRDCPGTRFYTCCGYKILHVGTFCTMDCAYCILQAYFHPPVLQFFVNHDELLAELNRFFAQPGVQRIGTGEFTDSLLWEAWTDLAGILVPRFGAQNRAVLELKSKTTRIEKLQALDHRRRTIMAWSLNTPKVIREQERSTASLQARLQAAARCEAWGYPLAFHFDPMVIYAGCREDYRQTVRQIFAHVSPENVAWISLGSFRFPPALKPIVEQRFPDSKIAYGEFIPGLDGKMRYFKPLRLDLYRCIVEAVRRYAPDTLVYFCMEDDTVWRKTFGFVPQERGGLPEMLDKSAQRVCGLAPNKSWDCESRGPR